jgi:hypothetical protein
MAKRKKDKQRSTKHTHKTKDWVTRTPLQTGGELMAPSSYSYYKPGKKPLFLASLILPNTDMTSTQSLDPVVKFNQ